MTAVPYPDARAVEAAIKAAAKATASSNPALLISDLIRQAYYDRFLCRVFSSSDGEWVLKGGTGMLARVPDARRTLDADLYRDGCSKDQGLAGLRSAAERDLGDHFRFVYREHHDILGVDNQPYADGYRVVFDTYLGTSKKDPIKVDLSAHVGATSGVTIADPANRLSLPRLATHPYRLYPIVNQIADKVCATISDYDGHASTRVKDGVDLVVIAVTQTAVAPELARAIQRECRLRYLDAPSTFTLPDTWATTYATLARRTPAASVQFRDAQRLVGDFVGPALRADAAGTWNPRVRAWSDNSPRRK